jgi:putative alpha-1,2-mannosidase
MIRSMLAHYDQSVHRMLPVWSHYANENWCMIGYHSVSVIADAVAKGNVPFDAAKALSAAITTSRQHGITTDSDIIWTWDMCRMTRIPHPSAKRWNMRMMTGPSRRWRRSSG